MPEQFPKISIVTASFNHVAYIEDCILSITSQNYPNLEYIIIDGGSTDGTTDIIRKYEDKIHYWVSEKDGGLYDALQKGFSIATGDIMGWLNSDDILHRKSLFSIAGIFSDNQSVRWIQGYPTIIEEDGRIVYHREARHSKYFFYMKGYHDGTFIQQESTYWRRDLWKQSGAFVSTKYKYAGDFELWIRFFTHACLYVTPAMIGAFRIRRTGQLSADNYSAYIAECDSIIGEALAKMPASELAIIKKMRFYSSIRRRFPLFAKISLMSRFLNKMNTARTIHFNFQDAVFRP